MESMKYSDTEFAVSLDPGQVVAEVHANAVNLPKRTVREHISYGTAHNHQGGFVFRYCKRIREQALPAHFGEHWHPAFRK